MHVEFAWGGENAFRQDVEGSVFDFKELDVDLELYGISIRVTVFLCRGERGRVND
jgi:hypothetical protein